MYPIKSFTVHWGVTIKLQCSSAALLHSEPLLMQPPICTVSRYIEVKYIPNISRSGST